MPTFNIPQGGASAPRVARKPQPRMVEKPCLWCKTPFQARAADVNRGWAKFCSKSCKAKEQEKRTGRHRTHEARAMGDGSSSPLMDEDAFHRQAMDDCTGGWDEGGWRGDESGCCTR